MDIKIIIGLISIPLGATITMFGWLWHKSGSYASKSSITEIKDALTHHKESAQYKANCTEITKGFTNEISRLGEIMQKQFEAQEKLEAEKMEFYKKHIESLSKNDEKLMDKFEDLLDRVNKRRSIFSR